MKFDPFKKMNILYIGMLDNVEIQNNFEFVSSIQTRFLIFLSIITLILINFEKDCFHLIK